MELFEERELNPTAWSKAIRKRDRYTCRNCGRNHNIVAHHKKPVIFGGKYILSNGIALCRSCNAKEIWKKRSQYMEHKRQEIIKSITRAVGKIDGIENKSLEELNKIFYQLYNENPYPFLVLAFPDLERKAKSAH